MPHPLPLLLSFLTGLLLVPALRPDRGVAASPPLTRPPANTGVPVHQLPRSPVFLAQQSNFTSFFEEGRSQSENRLRRPAPDPTIPVAGNSPAWQPIFFQAGGVSFWMPPGTLSEERVTLSTPVGPVNFRTLAADTDTSRYVVGYAEQLTPEQVKSPQLLLVGVANSVVSSSQFRLVRNQAISQGSVPGRELTYQSDTEVIVFRAFLRQNTGYVIGARSPRSDGVPSRQTTIFLNSFEFLS